jgi:hypothetical protein
LDGQAVKLLMLTSLLSLAGVVEVQITVAVAVLVDTKQAQHL